MPHRRRSTETDKRSHAPELTEQDLNAVFRALTGTAPTTDERTVLQAARRKDRPHPTP